MSTRSPTRRQNASISRDSRLSSPSTSSSTRTSRITLPTRGGSGASADRWASPTTAAARRERIDREQDASFINSQARSSKIQWKPQKVTSPPKFAGSTCRQCRASWVNQSGGLQAHLQASPSCRTRRTPTSRSPTQSPKSATAKPTSAGRARSHSPRQRKPGKLVGVTQLQMQRLRTAIATRMFHLRPLRHSDSSSQSREVHLDNGQAEEKAAWFSNLFVEVRHRLYSCRRAIACGTQRSCSFEQLL